MRPLPLSAALLGLLALTAPGCKGGCDGEQSGAGGAPSLSAPDSARFGRKNDCPGGNCSVASNNVAPASEPVVRREEPPPADTTGFGAFGDRRTADARAVAAPDAVVAARPVAEPVAEPAAATHAGVKELTDQASFDAMVKSGAPSVVKWYGNSCPPCRRLAPAYKAVAEELNGKVAFYQVNAQAPGAPNIPEVQSLPGLALYEGGRMVSVRNGLPSGKNSTESLKTWLRAALAAKNLQQ